MNINRIIVLSFNFRNTLACESNFHFTTLLTFSHLDHALHTKKNPNNINTFYSTLSDVAFNSDKIIFFSLFYLRIVKILIISNHWVLSFVVMMFYVIWLAFNVLCFIVLYVLVLSLIINKNKLWKIHTLHAWTDIDGSMNIIWKPLGLPSPYRSW